MFNFDHISISVEYLEETIKFYSIFGFKVHKEYHDDSVDIVMLKCDKIFLEIFHYNDYNPLPEHAYELEKDLKTVGTKHFGLNVKDIEETKQWVESNNLNDGEIEIHQGRLGRQYFFIKDPNGILLEIIEEGVSNGY